MKETVAEILKNLNIDKDTLAVFLKTSKEEIESLEEACCHSNLDPLPRKLYALEHVSNLLAVFVDGEDLTDSDILPVLQQSKITLELSHDDRENKYDRVTLLDLVNIDPVNHYWLPLIELAVSNYENYQEDAKEELN